MSWRTTATIHAVSIAATLARDNFMSVRTTFVTSMDTKLLPMSLARLFGMPTIANCGPGDGELANNRL